MRFAAAAPTLPTASLSHLLVLSKGLSIMIGTVSTGHQLIADGVQSMGKRRGYFGLIRETMAHIPARASWGIPSAPSNPPPNSEQYAFFGGVFGVAEIIRM